MSERGPAFTTSEQCGNVMAAYTHALDAALRVVKSKTADLGKYSIEYADLDDVLGAVREVLSENGAVITQVPSGSTDGATWWLTTSIIHAKTAEWIEFAPYTRPQVRDEQGFGGAITYARRYSLTAIFAIATKDDDATDVTQQQRNIDKYDGARTREELAVRAVMAVYPPDATFREAFLAEFGHALSELSTNKHAEALRFTAAWFATPGQAPLPGDPPAGTDSAPDRREDLPFDNPDGGGTP